MITKKYYTQFAQAFVDVVPEERYTEDEQRVYMDILNSFIRIFQADNPRFDAERFRKFIIDRVEVRGDE